MSDVNAVPVPERDLVRVDIPGPGHHYTVALTVDQATRLAAALKVALARLTPDTPRPIRGRGKRTGNTND